MLGADELVAHLLRLLDGEVQRGLGARRHVEHLVRSGGTALADGLVLGHLVGARHQRALVDAQDVEELLDDAAGQAEHADQEVLGAEYVTRAPADDALRRLQGFAGSF